ncbi:MAG TPA: metalloregulator ArsR/SmtB family transcription factor, partial [Actinomycetes bacterium]|nr:metalloregulator ArsR/SmtB family transcription factor [Actinomycetes bacterium]
MPVDETLRALAHPARRVMLELVWDAERSSSELAEAAALTRPAASQHLKVLRDAGLVQVRVDGNQRLYRVD